MNASLLSSSTSSRVETSMVLGLLAILLPLLVGPLHLAGIEGGGIFGFLVAVSVFLGATAIARGSKRCGRSNPHRVWARTGVTLGVMGIVGWLFIAYEMYVVVPRTLGPINFGL